MDNSFTPPGVPPQTTPPPIITPPPPARPRRSWGWIIASIILIVLLGFSLLGNLVQAVSHAFAGGFDRGFRTSTAREVGPKLDECLLEDNSAHNKIAVITVDGIITSHSADQAGNNMVDVIQAQLDRAKDDKRVKAVILKVDSPGGEVMASDQINKLIVDFQKGKPANGNTPAVDGKPVICSMGSLAASGGYYISAPCRWIVANRLTLTGSIGVIMEGINYRGLMDKIGLAPMVFKSGKYKDMLSGMQATNEVPAGENEMVQNLIMQTYGVFTNVVAQGRGAAHELNKNEGHALAPNWMSYADGRVLSGSQALALGFVDQVGDFNDAVEHAKLITHIPDANLIEYRERYDISDFLSMFGQSSSAAHDLKLDLGMDIPKLQAGCMYFLYEAPEKF